VHGAKLVWPDREIAIDNELEQYGIVRDAFVEHRLLSHESMEHRRRRIDFELRSAQITDLVGATSIHGMILDEHVNVSPFARRVGDVEGRFAGRFRAAMADRGGDRSLVYVAVRHGEVVGMAECFVEFEDEDDLDATVGPGALGYIHGFGIRADLRRKGIGSALATYVLSELRAMGLAQVRLHLGRFGRR
jgi:ribosomal protein S18 acetylase RimI-like enzyme